MVRRLGGEPRLEVLCTRFVQPWVGLARSGVPARLAVSVAAAIGGVVLWGTLLGSLLPLVLRRVGFDPAAASSPMVATLMDASGTLIYLGVAILLLTGTVL